jgi:hypothetical protein
MMRSRRFVRNTMMIRQKFAVDLENFDDTEQALCAECCWSNMVMGRYAG